MRTLVVDDDPAIQLLLRRIVSEFHLESYVCGSAEEALNRIAGEFFPIMILDVGLPGIDGLSLCRLIRQTPNGEQPVILVATAQSPANYDLLQEALDAGADDFLHKPIEIKLLRIRLKIMLQRAKDRQERLKAQHDLIRSESRLNYAQHIANIGSYEKNWGTGEEYWSNEFYNLLGYKPREIPPDFQLFLNQIHPTDQKLMSQHLHLDRKEPHYFDEEFRLIQKNGHERHCQSHGFVKTNEDDETIMISGTLMDISERKQVEIAFQKLVEGTSKVTGWDFFRSLTRYLAAVFRVKYAGISEVTDLNEGRIRIVSFWDGQIFSENIHIVVEKNNCGQLLSVQYHRENSRPCFCNHDHFRALPIESYFITPFFDALRRPIGHLFIMDDKPMYNMDWCSPILKIFAARAGTELERAWVEETLRKAKDAAESANRAKSEFLSHMSHELRTPLNGILGYTQILKRDRNLSENHFSYLDIIERSGSHLLNLINEILDLSKIEAQKVDLHIAPFSLRDFLQNLIYIIRIRAEQKNVEVVSDFSADLPAGVASDEIRLGQILLNLLSNAVKFTIAGQVTFSVRCVSGYTEASGDKIHKIRFCVKDTGIGIPPDKLQDIFSAFKQIANHTRSNEGTGLGLTISQKLVHLLGSELHVKSEENKGSQFWFDLDLKEDQVASKTVQAVDYRPIFGYANPRQHIMIVDDRFDNRHVLMNFLEPIGFQITEAKNGREALDLLANNPPHLILMDLVMPVLDGFETIRQIRANPRWNSIKIIAVSASSSLSRWEIIKQTQADDFIAKPVLLDELLNQIGHQLDLSWIYEDSCRDRTSVILTGPDSAERAVNLSKSDRKNLLQLAQLGKRGKILNYLDEIDAKSAKYRSVVEELRQLTNKFLFDELKMKLSLKEKGNPHVE